MSRFDVIAFDADDTLWHNETIFVGAQAEFRKLLARYHREEWIDERLHNTEMRNLEHFGYGVKGFALSMIETAIELTDGQIPGAEVQNIINLAREMLSADVELLEGVRETIEKLARSYPLLVITKGDLHDQETKLGRSGIAHHFDHVEVVSSKTRESYERVLSRHRIPPDRFLMVGNSLRSDILPILELGGNAVYVPYHLTWAHEAADPPGSEHERYYEIERLSMLPQLLETIDTDRTVHGEG
jgi:putative hydrolase of the HAD superfamily